MGVLLKKLELFNFRNHHFLCIDEPKELIIIVGRNAAGKTNIIEALQLVSMLESFRNPRWQDVVTDTCDEAVIQARFSQNERLIDIRMESREGKRSYSLNGKKKLKNSLKGIIPAVIFIPDDLALVKSSSEVRRKLLDDIGQQLSATYRDIAVEYQKTVRQRNSILKEQKDGRCQPHVLESWDENLLSLGSLLFVHRLRLYRRMVDKTYKFYNHFSHGETLISKYIPSFNCLGSEYSDEDLTNMEKGQIFELLSRTRELLREEECARGLTLVGPHKDEIRFFIEGHDARDFGSQGQQRSIALALKLAQLAVIQEISGNQPILLLDDVMSELDEKRRSMLIQLLTRDVQTVITATDLSFFDDDLLKNAQIIELKG
jgi:DNA replication and repair protein RecF